MRLPLPMLLIAIALLATPGRAEGQTPRPARRQPVTPELERTAFRDAGARTLLARARAARLAQDSALAAYDANTYMRFSIGLGVRRLGPQRLFLRTEQSARVRWGRDEGLIVEPTGRRTAFPMGSSNLDMTAATPIPYFPNRESLWMPGEGVAKTEVSEEDLLHPLATGAEAYYRYATGDSASIRLPDGRTIALRELRVTARRPEWRALVGSFWFDVERGNLVRAAYRMAVEMDMWQMASEEQRRELERWQEQARSDTGVLAENARRQAEKIRREGRGTKWAGMLFTPMRANISAITVEYGLHQGRFWLPRVNVAEGEVLAGFVRVPMKFEERFRYSSVNVRDTMVVALTSRDATSGDTIYWPEGDVRINLGAGRVRRPDTSVAAIRAREDSAIRRLTSRADSMRISGDSSRAKGDTGTAREFDMLAGMYASRARLIERRREGCASDTTYFAGRVSRYKGALHMAVRMPCDTSGFATSPDLPSSIFEEGEEVVGSSERDLLVGALGMGLQPDWSPRMPVPHTGLDMLRYNRIEGLSVGGSLTSELGRGYTARAVARLGAADLVPNGELSLERSNGRSDVRFVAYHRLAVANDDWGAPLSFGASVANLLYARDEGFYYRAYGAELAGTRRDQLFGANLQWRLFAEGHRSAGSDPQTQASFGNLFANPRFGLNIDVPEVAAAGGRVDLAWSFGADPAATRLDTRLRVEGAFVEPTTGVGPDVGYGRFAGDGTLAFPFGGFTGALTGAAGWSAGALPVQRAFYIGGLHTVRGQFARLDSGYVGNAFWLARAELGLVKSLALRPSLFYDLGWAGARDDFTKVGRPLSGAGVGVSLMDGLVRMDVARGIWPEQRWRADISLGARF